MSQKAITDLNINSLTISNSYLANATGYTAQSNILATNNAGVLLVNGLPISSGGSVGITAGSGITVLESPTGTFEISNDGVIALTAGTNITITGTKANYTINSTGGGGGGGGVDAVTAGTGINVIETPAGSGTFEIENTGVTSLSAGSGITLDFTTGDIQVSSTVNPTDYQTVTAMDDYSTTAAADLLYQAIGDYQTVTAMGDYSTTVEANLLYQSINGGVLSIIAGNGISVDTSTGNVTISSNKAIGSISVDSGVSALAPYGVYTEEITINNFNGNELSSYVISCNTANTTADLIASISYISSTTTTTVLQARFYNPTSTVLNGGFTYSVIAVNN